MSVEEAFRSAFRLMFGECNVKLDEFKGYFQKYQPKLHYAASSKSGKKVSLSGDFYPKEAKFISQDEIDFSKKHLPLSINEIKDTDSLIEAVSGRFCFAGNKIFGNSRFIESGDNIVDSFYVKESHVIHSSKYIGYCSHIRDESEFLFGSSWAGRTRFAIRLFGGFNTSRIFESTLCPDCSDIFCSFNLTACNDCMFSFNLKNRRNTIGNLELPRAKFLLLKKKIVDEIRERLERDKAFPSLFEISSKSPLPNPLPKIIPQKRAAAEDISAIDKSFRKTAKLVYGSQIGGIAKRSPYLNEFSVGVKAVKTPFGNIANFPEKPIFIYSAIPEGRIVTCEEAEELSKITVDEKDCQSFQAIRKAIGKIAFFRSGLISGTSRNNPKTVITWNATDTYEMFDATNGKCLGNSTMALDSSYCFGCHRAIHCSFCIRCHNCTKLSNCLEMDACTGCRNSMFCHNCENLEFCMFSSNVKNLKYAIGNVEVGREEYMKIREMVLKEVAGQIENQGHSRINLYDLGMHKP